MKFFWKICGGAACSTAALITTLALGGNVKAEGPSPHPLQWITLGTQGGPEPDPKRSEPSNVLLVGGRPWIVDCGDGAAERFAAAGFSPSQATNVFISHLHVDHVGGLQGLIALHWFKGGPNAPPLTVYGPPGIDALVSGVVQSLAPSAAIARAEQPGKWSPQASVRTVILRDGAEETVDGVRVRAVRNSHFDKPLGQPQENGTQSLSYRFDFQGYAIGYTGDTGRSAALERLMDRVDLLVSEVIQLAPSDAGAPGGGARRGGARPTGSGQLSLFHFAYQHLSPKAAGELAAAANVKRLVFTHLSVRGATDAVAPGLVAAARAAFKGEVAVAHDLDRF